MKKILKKLSILGLSLALSFSALSVIPTQVSEMNQVEAASLKLNSTKLNLRPDYYRTLKLGKVSAKKCTWKSSNKKVVTVNKNGKIYTKKKGKAVISCTYKNKTYKCTVNVVDDLKLKDFDYDTTAKDYTTSEYNITNAVQAAAFGYTKAKQTECWDYGEYISNNLRGLSIGASTSAIEKKYGECDLYCDKNTEVEEWLNVTSGFNGDYVKFMENTSYVWEYNNVIKYDGVDYFMMKMFYFDENDTLIGSVVYARVNNL